MNLSAIEQARRHAEPRPSWCAIFTKAYALTSAAFPELRRAYLGWPWAHLYEHPISVASVAIERRLDNESGVFFAHLNSPELSSLVDLDSELRRYKERPIESIGSFRRTLRISRLPGPIRRLVWWTGLNVLARKRAHFFGTYGVSVYSGLGASSLHPLSPLTTTLNYGVVAADGKVDVRVIYDHRVLDGATVARALHEMEQIFHCEVLAELRDLQKTRAA